MKNNKPATVKIVIAYILKMAGINTVIAYKQMEDKAGGNLYRTIKIALRHKRTPEDIYYHFHWQLSMTKDNAQY